MNFKKIFDKATNLFESNGKLLFIQWENSNKKIFYSYNFIEDASIITEEEYCYSIANNIYKKIELQLKSPLHNYSWTKGNEGDLYFHRFNESIIHGFNFNGIKTYEYDSDLLLPYGHVIYDIKFQSPNFMWLAFPTGQTVTQINLTTKEETYKIGTYTFDDIYDPLSYPEKLYINENLLYIPNMGTGELFKVNLNTYQLELYKKFEGKLWEYLIINKKEIIQMDNSIFIIE